MATDPICGMTVDESASSLRLVRENRTYYFCSSDCRTSFEAPEATRARLVRRLTVAWPLSAAIVGLTFFPGAAYAPPAAGALAAVVLAYPGSGFYRGAWDAVRRKVGNMDLLIAVGTTAAFLYSVAVLALPGRLPPGTYFDASSLIVSVLLSGSYLEERTRRRAGSSLRRLARMLPTTAERLDGPTARRVAVGELRVGERVRVGPGERFPTDGRVVRGTSAVDRSLLTGESAGARVGPGDAVLAGATNLEGPLELEVTACGPETFLAHVGEMLQDAELARVPLQRRADRLAARFVPFVLALAVAAGVGWAVLGGDATVGVLVFVTVAVTACPCAFGLATPAALLVGTGRAAEEGVLFRGGDAIERAATVDTVLFDKTGTLTSADAEVDRVLAVAPASEAEVVAIAAGLEQGIRHPLARALVAEAARRGVRPAELTDVQLEPGRGVLGRDAEHRYAIVRGDATTSEERRGPLLAGWLREVEDDGQSWSEVVRDERTVGAVAVRAPLLPDAAATVAALRSDGVRVALVTGDNARAARAVAERLGIDDVVAGVGPGEKRDVVLAEQGRGRRVAFVGDGVNDAPSLAAADLGIAVGGGTDVAREAGQVLLVRAGVSGVPVALRAARRIVGRVRANLIWAIGYNAVLLPVAAGALVPVAGLGVYRLLPVLGSVAMALSSTTVLLSSLSLRRSIRPLEAVPPPAEARSAAIRPEAV